MGRDSLNASLCRASSAYSRGLSHVCLRSYLPKPFFSEAYRPSVPSIGSSINRSQQFFRSLLAASRQIKCVAHVERNSLGQKRWLSQELFPPKSHTPLLASSAASKARL